MSRVRMVGVEEEMFLVDPQTCHIRPVSERAIRADEREDEQPEELEQELFLQQIEVNTEPTHSLVELRAHLVAGRERAASAAESPAPSGESTRAPPRSRSSRLRSQAGSVT